MKEITKDMLIGEILDAEPGTAVFFFQMGMHCLGCPAGVDPDALIAHINEYLAQK